MAAKRHSAHRAAPKDADDRARPTEDSAGSDPGTRELSHADGWSGRLGTAVVFALAVGAGLVALTLAAGSFLAYETVKGHLDGFASDGDADLTRAEFDATVVRLRLAALAAAVAAVALAVSRHSLQPLASHFLASAATASAELVRSLRTALAAESRLHLGALALVTLAALVVRLEFLFQPMRYDESTTFVSYVSPPWYVTLTDYSAPNNHVFHSLLAQISTFVFGGDPWALRLPAFLAGVLLVPATYVAARALYDKHAALVAAGLVAGSSIVVEYSTNARGYTLLALVFMLLLALATRLCSNDNPAEWFALALLAAIGFYTVPVMLYAFGVVVVWLALTLWIGDRRLLTRRLIPAVLVTGILSAILYSPVVAASGLDALVANEFVRSLPWDAFTAALPESLGAVWNQWHRDIPWPLALVLGVAFLAGVVLHHRLSTFAVPPALAAILWIGPLVVVQRVVPFERVWLFLVPLYLMTAAAAIVFVSRPLAARVGGRPALAVAVSVASASLLAGSGIASQSVYHSEETSTLRDGESIAGLLEERLRPGDKLITGPPVDVILEYLLGRRGLDPVELIYWAEPEGTRRFVVVVKKGSDQFSLESLLDSMRLRGVHLAEPRLVRNYEETLVYEVLRVG